MIRKLMLVLFVLILTISAAHATVYIDTDFNDSTVNGWYYPADGFYNQEYTDGFSEWFAGFGMAKNTTFAATSAIKCGRQLETNFSLLDDISIVPCVYNVTYQWNVTTMISSGAHIGTTVMFQNATDTLGTLYIREYRDSSAGSNTTTACQIFYPYTQNEHNENLNLTSILNTVLTGVNGSDVSKLTVQLTTGSYSDQVTYEAYWDNVELYTVSGDAGVSITYTDPATPHSTYKNVESVFSAGSDMLGNWAWYIDSNQVQTGNSLTNTSYFNSTASVGSYLVNATVVNDTSANSHEWTWNVLENSVDITITYYDPTNLSRNIIWDVSNATAGVQTISISYNSTTAGNTYEAYRSTGTGDELINTLVALSNNDIIWCNTTNTSNNEYYISESEPVPPTPTPATPSEWDDLNSSISSAFGLASLLPLLLIAGTILGALAGVVTGAIEPENASIAVIAMVVVSVFLYIGIKILNSLAGALT